MAQMHGGGLALPLAKRRLRQVRLEERDMKRWQGKLRAVTGVAVAACAIGTGVNALAADVTWERLLNADQQGNDWLMYHQNYKSWHYSPLSEINADNVKGLKVAWIHTPGATKRGVQSFPLAVDGVLYYTTANSVLWALDGATGQVLWKFQPKIDEERGLGTIYNPYNRGVAVGYGNVYVGTVDGRLLAVDMKTGKQVWDTQLMTVEKGNKGFTGAPLVVKDKVVIGSNGGELSGCCGPIFGVDAKTGAKAWQFDTIGGDDRSRNSWGNDSWKIGGGGGWMAGNYDPKTNTVFWGTANPAPDYDWAGEKWKTDGPRPGENLYSSSVVALDADSGKLKSWFQEMPHDAWDFDSAVGEFMMIERDGKNYVVHPNKGGYVFVYNRDMPSAEAPLKVENVWKLGETGNFISGIDPKTGQLQGRRELPEGKHKNVCPAIDGAISWNSGTYSPDTGLMYKIGQEWCFDIEVVKGDRPKDFSGQNYFGASWTSTHPEGKKAYGHVSGRDPITSKATWRVEYQYPPLASLLSTKGNLVFVPGADGMFDALDAKTGKKLWSHNNGIGHHGGVISYTAKGKQYIAVVTGWGSHVSGNYGPLFGEPFTSMPTDAGQLIVFGL
jgi:alcohol dehydrogenase (cytochrome c)